MAIQPMPQLMTANKLNPVRGWPLDQALTYRAKISPNVLYVMVSGQVGHLNASNQIEPGVVGQQMGLFLFYGASNPVVNNAVPPNNQWVPVSPTGVTFAMVAKGPFELETTEFDTTQSYPPNTLVRAPIGNADDDYPGSGQLTSAGLTFGTNAYCGTVSYGVRMNSDSVQVLGFWPAYGPVGGSS